MPLRAGCAGGKHCYRESVGGAESAGSRDAGAETPGRVAPGDGRDWGAIHGIFSGRLNRVLMLNGIAPSGVALRASLLQVTNRIRVLRLRKSFRAAKRFTSLRMTLAA